MLVLEQQANFEQIQGSFSSSSVSCSIENDISKALQKFEQANDLLLEVGRIFADTKEGVKRNFANLLKEAGLQKAQVDRLIKASTVAEEIPTVVARRLGINILAQLGQVKHQTILEAIEVTDDQISIGNKIKQNRSERSTPKEGVRLIGKKKGEEKLRIDIAGCPEARDIYEDFQATGLSPLEWLQNLRNKKPTLQEFLKKEALKQEAKSASVLALSEHWQTFPQSWKHEGKDCCYKMLDSQRTIRWGDFEIKVADSLAAKYTNPRLFLDFELLTPGALVEINAKGSTWHGLQVYVQEISGSGSKAKVYLQESNKEINFSINKLKVIEPSLNSWRRIN